MATPPIHDIAAALAEIVQDQLTHGEEVQVPGLGSFRVAHQPSQLEEQPDGEFIIKPPCDTIVFSSEL
jgi:nucleoid DNA-binding protein